MADGTLHIDLEIHVHGSEVQGRVAMAGRQERSFCGWIELLAALDGLVSGDES